MAQSTPEYFKPTQEELDRLQQSRTFSDITKNIDHEDARDSKK
ncbi:13887_t:CDS:2, partial [Entrophospora sp. SA101]